MDGHRPVIHRDLAPRLTDAARKWPAITLTGPRQSGKTVLCRMLFPDRPYVSLEPLDQRTVAIEDPRAFLAGLPDGGIIDEVQRAPDLLSYLQEDIDLHPGPGRWVLTGSQNLLLLESVSQSLAGRAAIHHLLPLARGEVERFDLSPEGLNETLYTGSYPRVFDLGLNATAWYETYVASYIERDVRTLRNVGDLKVFQQFLKLCAGRTAQLLNIKSLAGDCGISQPTAKAWLGILEASFIAFRLPAYRSNLRKRLVKMPKLHFYDTGLVCYLLNIDSPGHLQAHPLRGPLFETWVASEIFKRQINQGRRGNLSFYREDNNVETDLVIDGPAGITLIEAKSAQTPSLSLFDPPRQVRRLLRESPQSCAIAAVYGGEESVRCTQGHLISWKDLHRSFPVRVSSEGQPVADVQVLALFPNKTSKQAMTDSGGTAWLELHRSDLPMTVFAAAEGFAAHLESDWKPAEGPLVIDLDELPGGGAAIFPKGTGHLPAVKGRLNPVLDTLERTYLYADNIAINGGIQKQPTNFSFGEELHLADADGKEVRIQIIGMRGRAALVQYYP